MKGQEDKKLLVTVPLLPPLEEFVRSLEDIWDRKWITNNGSYHQALEEALCAYLRVPYICLFTNGTLPLMVGLQALRITGEVITTPYSFVATTHALWWNGVRPVFVDIDPKTGNMDPDKIEAAITPQTTAIMPVHVYGNPCDTVRIRRIADTYGLKVLYDAAHAFGVEKEGEPVLAAGDMSTLSFHATKVYNTIEGGALVCHDAQTKYRIDYLKNFGFAGETTVIAPGINGKMDEIRAAYGLLELKHVDDAIAKRKNIAALYRTALKDVAGLTFYDDLPGVRHNYSYFPVFIDATAYGKSRDDVYDELRRHNIFGRRYFYPLITAFPIYKGFPSAAKENLPNAHMLAERVICLPISHEIEPEDVERVCRILKHEETC